MSDELKELVNNCDGCAAARAETEAYSTKSLPHPSCFHCWHDSGMRGVSNPPTVIEICCRCGGQKHLRPVLPIRESLPGHGPFAPREAEPLADRPVRRPCEVED